MRSRSPFIAAIVIAPAVLAGCSAVERLLPAIDLPAPPPPAWSTRLADQLECDGPPSPLGAASDPVAGGLSVHGRTADAALEAFRVGEAPWYGFLPLDHWQVVERDPHWLLEGHVVDGRPKALATFTDDPPNPSEAIGQKGDWIGWQVAACDASEFDANAEVGLGLVVWTDVTGRRISTTQLMEADLCSPMRRLELDGHVFVRDPSGAFADRLEVPYAAEAVLPKGARDTGYRDGDRHLWLAADGRAAYVGEPGSIERWPRVRNDDASVTDCG